MDLTTANARFRNVTEQNLEDVFADDYLRGEFAVLEADNENFLQVGGEYDGPLILEIKRGGEQFQALGELTKQDVRTAFMGYLRGETDWQDKWKWKKLELKKGCLKKAAMLVLTFCGSIWLLLAVLGRLK